MGATIEFLQKARRRRAFKLKLFAYDALCQTLPGHTRALASSFVRRRQNGISSIVPESCTILRTTYGFNELSGHSNSSSSRRSASSPDRRCGDGLSAHRNGAHSSRKRSRRFRQTEEAEEEMVQAGFLPPTVAAREKQRKEKEKREKEKLRESTGSGASTPANGTGAGAGKGVIEDNAAEEGLRTRLEAIGVHVGGNIAERCVQNYNFFIISSCGTLNDTNNLYQIMQRKASFHRYPRCRKVCL